MDRRIVLFSSISYLSQGEAMGAWFADVPSMVQHDYVAGHSTFTSLRGLQPPSRGPLAFEQSGGAYCTSLEDRAEFSCLHKSKSGQVKLVDN